MLEVEPTHVEHLGDGDVGADGPMNPRERVHRADTCFERVHLGRGREVGLVQDDDVRERDLLLAFIGVVDVQRDDAWVALVTSPPREVRPYRSAIVGGGAAGAPDRRGARVRASGSGRRSHRSTSTRTATRMPAPTETDPETRAIQTGTRALREPTQRSDIASRAVIVAIPSTVPSPKSNR